MKTRTTLQLVLVAVVLLGLVAVVRYQQDIRDWLFLRTYEPAAEVDALAVSAEMSETGSRYFYLGEPDIVGKDTFAQRCDMVEGSFVLGCYRGDDRIFILGVQREELDGIQEVTAAHEMLHAAYARLSWSERREVDGMVEDEFSSLEDKDIRDTIARYEERGGEDMRRDELHSILPTQVEDLSPDLERYYEQYFKDRQQVVDLYHQYRSTFTDIHERIDELRGRIENQRGHISRLEKQLELQRTEVERLDEELTRRRERGDTESYNRLVPDYNAAVDTYNNSIRSYRTAIERHNRLVDELNQDVVLQRDLANSLDVTYDEL